MVCPSTHCSFNFHRWRWRLGGHTRLDGHPFATQYTNALHMPPMDTTTQSICSECNCRCRCVVWRGHAKGNSISFMYAKHMLHINSHNFAEVYVSTQHRGVLTAHTSLPHTLHGGNVKDNEITSLFLHLHLLLSPSLFNINL